MLHLGRSELTQTFKKLLLLCLLEHFFFFFYIPLHCYLFACLKILFIFGCAESALLFGGFVTLQLPCPDSSSWWLLCCKSTVFTKCRL